MPRLMWYGPEILARVEAAAKVAVDETTAAAAKDAEGSHWWVNRTEQLEDEIISEPAGLVGPLIVGKFGSTKRRGFYGLILEHRSAFLRPAADRTFPGLALLLKARL